MNNNVFSIPASLAFADTLAGWILETHGRNPIELPKVLVLLPSRRACLSLREAFLRATNGAPTLLPRMQPLGDVDTGLLMQGDASSFADIPQPAFATKRLFMLAHLLRAYTNGTQGRMERMDHALQHAQEVARLLDEVEREGASLAELSSLVPDMFAAHWQHSTEFLTIVAEHWPKIAAEKQLVSPEEWRRSRLLALAARWQVSPPAHPVIAAGTTGSVAATAALLKTILHLPEGSIVLPGLDTKAGEAYAEYLTESHPQWGMHALLRELEISPADVKTLGVETDAGCARAALLSRALCPADLMQQWREPFVQSGLAAKGLTLAPCADQQEEAAAIAVMLREVLETPGKTAALVTHDRTLARRVSAECLRFGITIDDSAGKPLATTPAASFLRLLLEVAESGAVPVKLLALLKHPFARMGMERADCLEAARTLERAMLRGLCPVSGLEGLKAEAAQRAHHLLPFIDALSQGLGKLLALGIRAGSEELATLVDAHMEAALSCAGDVLWQGEEADELTAFIDELREAAADAGRIEIAGYPAVFEALLSGRVVRAGWGMHPRLKILSPLEARMQSFDRIIIGGLNEGSWPAQVASDPWFNRPMRASIGLSVPERQTGQAAHDFMMLACAPEVIVTRAAKVDGSPVPPARWWVRLLALCGHYGIREQVLCQPYAGWAGLLDAVENPVPCTRPAPCAPAHARPREIAVTQVETWMTDPYAFYVANVLKLRPLDPVDMEPAAVHFGIGVHAALQKFAETYPAELPSDPLRHLLQCGREAFAQHEKFYPVVTAWWWPRFAQVAEWYVEREKELRPFIRQVRAEVRGELKLEGITFVGRADRIEELKQGGLAIVDYKTGGAHTAAATKRGQAVQLMLLALLAREGQWGADIAARGVARLEYWIAGGGRNSGEIRAVSEAQIADYTEHAKAGFLALIRAYADPLATYQAAYMGKEDYAHLARVEEWR